MEGVRLGGSSGEGEKGGGMVVVWGRVEGVGSMVERGPVWEVEKRDGRLRSDRDGQLLLVILNDCVRTHVGLRTRVGCQDC